VRRETERFRHFRYQDLNIRNQENPQKFRYYSTAFFFERRANRERLAA